MGWCQRILLIHSSVSSQLYSSPTLPPHYRTYSTCPPLSTTVHTVLTALHVWRFITCWGRLFNLLKSKIFKIFIQTTKIFEWINFYFLFTTAQLSTSPTFPPPTQQTRPRLPSTKMHPNVIKEQTSSKESSPSLEALWGNLIYWSSRVVLHSSNKWGSKAASFCDAALFTRHPHLLR